MIPDHPPHDQRGPTKLRAAIDFVVNGRGLRPTERDMDEILYLADYRFYQQHGQTITGLDYRRSYSGPLNHTIHDCLDKMVEDLLLTPGFDYVDGHYYTKAREYQGGLSEEEKDTLLGVVDERLHMTDDDFLYVLSNTEPMKLAATGEEGIIGKYTPNPNLEGLAGQIVTWVLGAGWQEQVAREVAQKVLLEANLFAGKLQRLVDL